MDKVIAFLRAINVGGHTVKMDQLRLLFDELGLQNVETFIASGNVIFDPPAGEMSEWEFRIANHLESQLGYGVQTFLRSNVQLKEIIAAQPFAVDMVSRNYVQYVGFLATPLDIDQETRLLALRNPVDELAAIDREIHWLRHRDMGETSISGAVLEKAMALPTTIRNVNTVQRLLKKYPV